MVYCHHCGKKNEEKDVFCSNCGRNLSSVSAGVSENLEDTSENIKEIVVERKGGGKGAIKLLIFLIIIGYIALDLWAISQLRPIVTVDSVFTSISNFKGDISLSQTTMESTIRIENPTFVPILFGRIAYDANYGNTKVAEGKTGFFIMAPNSQKDISADLKIYNLNTLFSAGKLIWDTITGKTERKYVNMYADIGITKFKIGTLE